MTAYILISCPDHPFTLGCDDDRAYDVDTVESAHALYAAQCPAASGKRAYVVISCDLGGCTLRIAVQAPTVAEARAVASEHNEGWYTARRSRNRVVDGCQYHLGACCIHHADRCGATVDPNAILPDRTPEPRVGQLDLFSEVA